MNHFKNTLAIAARFSAAAASYHQAAMVQEQVAKSLSSLFPNLPAPPDQHERILEIGCGTGFLTELIRQRYPQSLIDAADASAGMIAQARARLKNDRRIRWQAIDLRGVPMTTQYPLILSSSALHWIDPLDEGLTRIAALLKASGQALFSLMLDGTLGELQHCRRQVAPHKLPKGRLPTLSQVRRGLEAAKLKILMERYETYHPEYPSADDFLRCIHAQGLTGGAVSSSHLPLNRQELRKLCEIYQALYTNSTAGVTATYCVAYFKVQKDTK